MRWAPWITSCIILHYYAFLIMYIIMPYYDLFSRDLHILDLWWRSSLCSLLFCRYYPCVHYFYVPWLIMTSQWLITLVGCPIVAQQWVMTLLGTYIVMPQLIMTLLCVHNMASQWIMTLLGTSFAMYYYAKLWYCSFTSKHVKIVHINH